MIEPMPKVPSPVRPVRQRRSRETRDAILAVVERLVTAGEFDRASVQDIVREAGTSVGAFYGRFADKNAALFCFYDSRCGLLERRLLRKLSDGSDRDISARLDIFIEEIVHHTLAGAAFLRASRRHFFGRHDSVFLGRARTLNLRLYMLLNPLLASNRQRLSHNDIETATWFCLALVGGLVRDGVLAGSALAKQQMDATRFVAELRRAVFGYLGLKAIGD